MTASSGHSLPVPATCPPAPAGHVCRVAAWLLAAGLLALGAGWFFHTSPNPRFLGKYSPAWATFLVLVVAGEALALGTLSARRRRLPELFRKLTHVGVSVILAVALVGLPAYIWLHHRYLAAEILRPMWRREHPFLQWDQPLPGNPSPAKPPGVVRVVCMGGSTTQGYRVEPKQSYPAVLQTLLDERFGPGRFEVINAGSCWHTTQHTLIKYLSRLCDYDPDLIIEMHAWNDLYQCGERVLARGPFRSDYGHFMGALSDRLRPRDRFAERVWRNPFFDNLYSDFRRPAEHPSRREPVDPLAPLPSFRRNLRHMADLCAADGVLLVLAAQPFLYKPEMSDEESAALTYRHVFTDDERPDLAAMRKAMIEFNEAARRVAEEKNLTFVDLEPALPQDLDHFLDDVHWTPLGCRLVAEAVFRQIDWPSLLPSREQVASAP